MTGLLGQYLNGGGFQQRMIEEQMRQYQQAGIAGLTNALQRQSDSENSVLLLLPKRPVA